MLGEHHIFCKSVLLKNIVVTGVRLYFTTSFLVFRVKLEAFWLNYRASVLREGPKPDN
jgi:hypothetical protein